MSELCSLETSNVCRTRDTGVKANTEEEETVNRTLREFPISLLSNAFRREHNAFRSPPRDCFPIFIREIGKKIECSKSMCVCILCQIENTFQKTVEGTRLIYFRKTTK